MDALSCLRRSAPLLLVAFVAACGAPSVMPPEATVGPDPKLPPPQKQTIPTVKVAKAVGWPAGAKPAAAPGVAVNAFADKLEHPRWLHVLPNGDVLVAESDAPPKPESGGGGLRQKMMGFFMKRAGSNQGSANRITLLRDADGDGVAETRSVFLQGLNSPFGMALVGNDLYVANADAVMRFPYTAGQTRIEAAGTRLTDLPAGRNHHWTKSLIASRDGRKLYATVGSNSNVAENGMQEEEGRAAIWEIDRATGQKRLFATGIRNPNGMAWEPRTGVLWTVSNERDEIGNDLVPDYLTSVKDGGFYGWPWSYWGQNVDARVQPPRPDMVARAIKPDYALGPHVAALGLAAAESTALPAPFDGGMFVGLHGSWNRKPPSGYKVVFVPFANGRPSGPPVDVLTGFLSPQGEAYGRPVGVAIDRRGSLLVADDVGDTVWRASAAR
ncbi:MAG TPA: sorbosone dehydrogenase family protein [Albitalea sp.]